MSQTLEEIQQEYLDLCHAMQSGVAGVMNYEPSETTPKHLRVGVNSTMVSQAGLVTLLMHKGVITELEYFTAMRDAMRDEVSRYKQRLTKLCGGNINLA
jgi:hypothetical protein